MISDSNVYLQNPSNITLTPLHKAHKRGMSGSKWKQAHQAVKHDRRNSLKKATIGNLIQALGALFIWGCTSRLVLDIACPPLDDLPLAERGAAFGAISF